MLARVPFNTRLSNITLIQNRAAISADGSVLQELPYEPELFPVRRRRNTFSAHLRVTVQQQAKLLEHTSGGGRGRSNDGLGNGTSRNEDPQPMPECNVSIQFQKQQPTANETDRRKRATWPMDKLKDDRAWNISKKRVSRK